MSMTLLQNYILAICMMKNIAMKFLCDADPSLSNIKTYN
jgi:hypothetical protein